MHWLSFFVVAGGVFISTLDSSMINVALPAIMRDFGAPLHHTEWVVLIYLLTITGTLLLWGHLSDRIGRGLLYTGGLSAFGLGALACTMAPQLSWLIAARLCQALGAAMMMATGPAIIRESFPEGQIGRGLGLIGMAVSLGLMTGPSLGGFLLTIYAWPAVFLVSGLLGLLLALAAGIFLPSRVADRQATGRFDLQGGLLWIVSLSLISLAVSQAASDSWSLLMISAALMAGAFFLLLLIRTEARVPHPLLPLALLEKGYFRTALSTAVISFMVLFTALLLIPFYLDRILCFNGMEIGTTLLAIPLTAMLVAPLAGRLSDRIGARWLTTGGLLLATAGSLLLATLSRNANGLEVAWRLGLLGIGQAMFLSPNSASVLARAASENTGATAALLATARNLGMLLGIALAGLVFSLAFNHFSGGLEMREASPAQAGAFMTALRFSFLVTAAIGMAGALISGRRE